MAHTGGELMPGWQTKALWAKKGRGNREGQWLPLIVHMSDAAAMAKLLWHQWLPSCTKRVIARGLGILPEIINEYEDAALPCCVFLAAGHDAGKATPAFQGISSGTEFDCQLRAQLSEAGLILPNRIHTQVARHYWASQLILEKHGFDRRLAVTLGGHHGQPPSHGQLNDLRTAYARDLGWNKQQQAWEQAQQELLQYALRLAGVSDAEARSWQPDITAQVLLSGLVIMVDWIVSNETHFPYIELAGITARPEQRALAAWEELMLPECWNPDNSWEWMGAQFFERRFNIKKPRPIQDAMPPLLGNISNPGIIILEAPMGEGKTEAALTAAEIMANRTRRSGIFFALPTQASANGLFLRFCDWIERLEDDVEHSIKLAHGKANLNEIYNQITRVTGITGETNPFWVGGEESEETYDDAVIVHDWFSGRKKGILADFVIGTVDQVLMAGLKQKHLALRHLGLANKVVIVDECHAYDAYMSQYLHKVLNWLGAYSVPVIILSATLPGEKRRQLIDAYLNKESLPAPDYDPIFDQDPPEAPPPPAWATTYDYPIITFTDGPRIRQEKISGERRSLEITVEILPDEEQIVPVLKDLLSEGGCAGIIVNTVKRAQNIARILNQCFGEEQVRLIHSRFLAVDRAQKEKDLFEKLGADGERPQRCIVVGTQIFEQSCDLDFDLLISDICPMDLLVQRIGRLHRHPRRRVAKLSQPRCFVAGISDSGFDRGAELVYSKYLLMNTRELLPSTIKLPDDIPRLVQKTYCPEGLLMPQKLMGEYKDAQTRHYQLIAKKETRARDFQISDPYKRLDDLVGWLDTGITGDPSGKRGEATVRDTETSLEVLVVQRYKNTYRMLPWLVKSGGRSIAADLAPDPEIARALAECSIQLPRELCWDLDRTIEELEKISLRELRAWQRSPWLKGELFLILDEELKAELCGYRLHYDQCYGMFSEKIEKGDENAGEGI